MVNNKELKQQQEYIYCEANGLYDKVYRRPENLLARLKQEGKDTEHLEELLELTRTLAYEKTKTEYDLKIANGVVELNRGYF